MSSRRLLGSVRGDVAYCCELCEWRADARRLVGAVWEDRGEPVRPPLRPASGDGLFPVEPLFLVHPSLALLCVLLILFVYPVHACCPAHKLEPAPPARLPPASASATDSRRSRSPRSDSRRTRPRCSWTTEYIERREERPLPQYFSERCTLSTLPSSTSPFSPPAHASESVLADSNLTAYGLAPSCAAPAASPPTLESSTCVSSSMWTCTDWCCERDAVERPPNALDAREKRDVPGASENSADVSLVERRELTASERAGDKRVSVGRTARRARRLHARVTRAEEM